jgi:formamidopyrimidine-DNA glycosylase
MPELPEVETIARGLHQRVAGDAIEEVWLSGLPQTFKSKPAEIAALLPGARILSVRRMGKHIVFDLQRNATDPGGRRTDPVGRRKRAPGRRSTTKRPPGAAAANPQWIVHLGMTGRMVVCGANDEIVKHTHAIAKLGSGRELRFIDPRRFGRLSVQRAGGFDAGGVEPLEIDLEPFLRLFHARKTPIKSALLNQKLLRGVGNIYADESLFRAGIRPRRRASSLTRDQLARLHASVQEVLREAIALSGSTISDYVDSDGEEGFFQLQHRVYGREGEPCLVCKSPVKRVVLAGRSSHYCPNCQK